ncbi:hypothetical protein JT306_23515 [Salmonella enterica subsp. enterica serovar Kentucky]|nr:hypothetical protein [Salmonella enterica subsp. enterica serovar Kentucky]
MSGGLGEGGGLSAGAGTRRFFGLNGGRAVYPAGAGNTAISAIISAVTSVYPAGAGNTRFKNVNIPTVGLSPLARDTQQTPGEKRGMRFIPLAREHIITGRPGGAESGLSPLAREHRVQVRQIYKNGLSRWRGNTLNLPN